MEKGAGSPQTSDQRALDIATCWECGGESPQSRRLRVCPHLCVCMGGGWGGVHTNGVGCGIIDVQHPTLVRSRCVYLT